MDTTSLMQRRQLVVDPKFQYGLILKIIFLMAVVLLVSLVLLTITFEVFSNIALPLSVSTKGIMSFGATQGIRLSDVIKLSLAVLLFSVVIGSIAVYFFGINFSHRMAGPLPRLRKYITEMGYGDLDKKVTLRQKDYFQALATDINNLRQGWYYTIQELQDINKQLHEVANEEQREILGRFSILLSDLTRKTT